MSSGDFGGVYFTLPSLNDVKDFASDIALETADGLKLGMSFIKSFGNICLRAAIGSQASNGNDMQRAVGRPVTTAVQTMYGYFARGSRYRTDAT